MSKINKQQLTIEMIEDLCDLVLILHNETSITTSQISNILNRKINKFILLKIKNAIKNVRQQYGSNTFLIFFVGMLGIHLTHYSIRHI